ncbi:acetyltransferase [Sphingobacterium bovistauri]|uniref:Acetyltransferase n=1 Tax=Sphingobacterium bovistauri TaxID=2781959 RepID=A0ABS7Z3S2_9SPHI|nr:acetyltransferase [Sphingobacterium bovistauri]MCA5004212.1 acetyltransferase [Sphingobacterium bovistauri]
MVILGAGGFAKEILQTLEKNLSIEEIVFFDDVSLLSPNDIFNKYPILRSKEELKNYFETKGPNFVLGLGNPKLRAMMADLAKNLGGILSNAIDPNATIGEYCSIGNGATILSQACISNSAQIGEAALIYYNCIVTHDCHIGDYVELSPGSTLLGRVKVGNFTQVGANATILPGVCIGDNCIIGAGAIVTKDVPDNQIVVGNPAKFLKYNS